MRIKELAYLITGAGKASPKLAVWAVRKSRLELQDTSPQRELLCGEQPQLCS